MGEIIGLIAVIGIFGTPVIAVVSHHLQKVAEIKAKSDRNDAALTQELRALKQQVEELRDTTTRYDMSFDTALQRMDSRMANLEQRVRSVEGQSGVTPEAR